MNDTLKFQIGDKFKDDFDRILEIAEIDIESDYPYIMSIEDNGKRFNSSYSQEELEEMELLTSKERLTLKHKFYKLLDENKKSIDYDKIDIIINEHFIDIADKDENGGTLYSRKFYSVYEAYNHLESSNALIDIE